MSHFGMSYDEVYYDLPYRNLVMLSASVPKYKSKEEKEKPKSLADMLSNQLKNTTSNG